MRERPLPSSRIQRYFRGKTRELLAVAGQAIAEHPGLIGSHREQIIRIYLDAILPRRFKVGRGMIYHAGGHRSNEADIVLWDAENYPSLVMQDHSFFFAESVNAVLEVKSNWSTAELEDIKGKCNRISNLLPLRDLSVADEIASLRLDVASLGVAKSMRAL